MFWKFATTSNIDSILEKEDVTLRELMDDDDILQECKGQNTKLVKFLSQPDILEELVSLIITDPSSDADDAVKYKYPNIACELLTSDVPQINEMLGETENLREKLFSFLDNEPTLNPLLASFFSKVVGILLSRKPERTLEYIKSKSDFLGSVLKHLGTSAIMDLLLRLVTCVESADLRAQILLWLNENKLIERLVGLIDPSVDEEFHCNSAQSLCDIIRLSREHMYTMQESAQDDPLLNTLERKETVQLLLHHMFDNDLNESVIVNGISVLLTLLEIRRPAPFGFPEMAPELTQLDVERLASGVSKTLHGLSEHLANFHKLLETPPHRDSMHCTFGELDPPLGNTRLHVGKLLSAVLITNTHNINVQLSELQIFNVLLDLFFRYEYNNFLHTQVVQCIQTVLNNAVTITPPRAPVYSSEGEKTASDTQQEEEDLENLRKVAPLLTHLFEDCRLIQRILDAWEDNKVHETEAGGHRKGYMGHLTIITNQILENIEKGTNSERIRQFIEGMPEEDQGRWQKFVTEPLAEMNDKNTRELGGPNPMHFSSDDDTDTDYNIPFATTAQQAYTDYQLQQITSTFIDQFGFTDRDFADQDEAAAKFDKINSIDFTIKADTDTLSQELVRDTYHSRIPNLGDSSDEEEVNKFDTGDDGDNDWDVTTNDRLDSAFKYGTEPPTVTIRPRSESLGSNSSDEGDSTIPTTQFKIPVGSDNMETTQGSVWRNFEDSDSTESNSTPTSSPRSGGVSSPDFETSLWTSANTEITEGVPQDNWANFDNIESFANSNQGEDVFETTPNPETQQQTAAVQVKFEAAEDKQLQNEKMDIAVDSVPPNENQTDKVPSAKSVTSLSDVVMEFQENAPVDTSGGGEAPPNVSESNRSIVQGSNLPCDAVAMETDEVISGSAISNKNLSRKDQASRLTEEDNLEHKSSSPPAYQQLYPDNSSTQQQLPPINQSFETANDKASIRSDVNNPPNPGTDETLHIEGSEDMKTETSFPTDLSTADNGDGVACPIKGDSNLESNDAAPVQMNGPV